MKASLLGRSLTVPVSEGGWRLGTWQGIYLCEHRDSGGFAVALPHALRRIG